MPYPLLFKEISSKIAQKYMDLITAYYQQLRVCSSKTIRVLAFIFTHMSLFFYPTCVILAGDEDISRGILEEDEDDCWR